MALHAGRRDGQLAWPTSRKRSHQAKGFSPPTEPELAWVQHALAHLSPGGTAVVLMPPAAASRPAGRRVRAELIRRGALRAVVALPAGLMPPTAIGLHIWVLTQPDTHLPPTGGLLVVDTTAALPDRTLLNIVEPAWHAHLSGEHVDEPGVCRTVPVIETLDDQVDLTPQRYLPRASTLPTDPNEIIRRIEGFERLGELRDHLPPVRGTQVAPLRAAPHADIADLIRSGSISVLRATSRRQASHSAVTSSVLTAADIISESPASGSTIRDADDASPLVHAGDILMPAIGTKVHARVATTEHIGAALGPGVQLVRVDNTRFDPSFIAGILSLTDNVRVAGRASTGSVRIDVKRLTIPVLPLAQQQAYGEAFRKLVDFRTALEETAKAGAALAREVGDNLFGGTSNSPTSNRPATDSGCALENHGEPLRWQLPYSNVSRVRHAGATAPHVTSPPWLIGSSYQGRQHLGAPHCYRQSSCLPLALRRPNQLLYCEYRPPMVSQRRKDDLAGPSE
ncbi:N-6 DNA methylase [Micromonospora sp. C32]|uniref:N-6 DNA methylase n=1 Tax=Micromonospora sp. C32 TaxID=2824877 RepID=UPI001B38FF5D|nr:N-6 DNA methylase [Micromonospora sp. C32]MBQ1053453.1 N-6 DNA methylase [Micromonospora sp. C32]